MSVSREKKKLGLIIETSTECGLLCIASDYQVIHSTTIQPARNLSKELLPALQNLFFTNNLTLKELDYVAIGIGPGSYSGTRVGAIIGKSLAFGLNLPLIGFESPLAFLPDCSGKFVFLADAKMDHYYLLKGTKNENQVTLDPSPHLIQKSAFNPNDFAVDFFVLPSTPLPNPGLISHLVFEKFIARSGQAPDLLYYR